MTTSNRQRNGFRVEEDSLGKVEVPASRLWGAQTQRSHLNFPIGVERYRWGRSVIRALGSPQEVRRPGQRRVGPVAAREGRLDRAGRARGDRRQAGRRVPARGLSDRFRHPDQHERQRGDRQSRHPACRRRGGVEEADPPQRRREPQPVVQRHLPDRDAHRYGRAGRRRSAARDRRPARYSGRQIRGIFGRGDGGPDPSPGRDAFDPGAGDFGLGGAARAGPGRNPPQPAGRVRAGDWGNGGWHGAERRSPLRRVGRAQNRRGDGKAVRLGLEQVRRPVGTRRHGEHERGAAHAWREPS